MKDSSETLRLLFGEPDPSQYKRLCVPDEEEFREMLSKPACCICGLAEALNVACIDDQWQIVCDHHHPHESRWTHISRKGLPFEARRAVWHRDGGRCVICGSKNYLTFGHVIPANRGGSTFRGSNCETNLRLKCRTCNYSKGNKLIP